MEEHERLLVSHPSPDGAVVICAVAAYSAVVAEFIDEDGSRDITALVPDLLLLGLAAHHGNPDDVDSVRGGDLVQVGRVLVVGEPPELLFAAPAAQLVSRISFDEALPYIEAGVAAQVTAGVRADQLIEADQLSEADPGIETGPGIEADQDHAGRPEERW
jgi:hypothetical protein